MIRLVPLVAPNLIRFDIHTGWAFIYRLEMAGRAKQPLGVVVPWRRDRLCNKTNNALSSSKLMGRHNVGPGASFQAVSD